MILSLVTIFLMTFGITAICVGVGAIYPKFAYDHVAEIPTSFGGAICMIFSIGFIGLVVMIEAWPVYLLTSRSLGSGSHISIEWVIAPSLIAAIALTIAAVVVPIRKSLKSLEEMRA
jgi:ABC-2 type transport system permease protein